MTSLHILFISPYVPSLIRVRPYNLIKHLAQRGHRVDVLQRGESETAYDDGLVRGPILFERRLVSARREGGVADPAAVELAARIRSGA